MSSDSEDQKVDNDHLSGIELSDLDDDDALLQVVGKVDAAGDEGEIIDANCLSLDDIGSEDLDNLKPFEQSGLEVYNNNALDSEIDLEGLELE